MRKATRNTLFVVLALFLCFCALLAQDNTRRQYNAYQKTCYNRSPATQLFCAQLDQRFSTYR